MYDVIDSFAEYLVTEKGYGDNTLNAYTSDLVQLNDFLINEQNNPLYDPGCTIRDETVDVKTISRQDLNSFIGFLFDCGLDFSSICRKISTLKSFFSFLFNSSVIETNIAYELVYPKKKKRLPLFLDDGQVDSLLDFPSDSFIDVRDKAMIHLFYSTGCRVSEIEALNIEDLDLEKMRIKVLGKGGKERYVFVGREAAMALGEYFRARSEKDINLPALFVNSRGERLTSRGIFYIIDKRARAAGFAGSVTPHTLRHSFATEIMNNGADIKAVQDLLGHRNINTTQVYTHTSTARLQKLYEKFHPHAK